MGMCGEQTASQIDGLAAAVADVIQVWWKAKKIYQNGYNYVVAN